MPIQCIHSNRTLETSTTRVPIYILHCVQCTYTTEIGECGLKKINKLKSNLHGGKAVKSSMKLKTIFGEKLVQSKEQKNLLQISKYLDVTHTVR